MSTYVDQVLNNLQNKYHWEKEFVQSVTEVFRSISKIVENEPSYRKYRILERIVEPERVVTFRVPWKDDRGEINVNTGHRVEFNSALGPYKGGLRFHASVTLSILKFLGFEQIFKNALTGLPMGGGKGGSDFSPTGKSDDEIMNFCQSFMTELSRHIGANTDVPAGDIGVGGREIGYLFGQYKRIKNSFEGVLTGKGLDWGGSLIRPEATGFGLVYFVDEMLKNVGKTWEGKTASISGFGNVAWGAITKINELGGKAVTLSGPDGFIHDPDGIVGEKLDYLLKMRLSGRDLVKDYADEFKVKFYEGKRPWSIKADIALPCATQNELDENDAAEIIKNDTLCVGEGANLPVTLSAMGKLTESKVMYAPGKASNAGGVACSGLEMTQNSMRIAWTREEVDSKLKQIMGTIHASCLEASTEYGIDGDYVAGANIVGFRKVAQAMLDQGLV